MGVIYVFSTGGNGWVKIVVVLSAKGTLHVVHTILSHLSVFTLAYVHKTSKSTICGSTVVVQQSCRENTSINLTIVTALNLKMMNDEIRW